MNSQSCLSFLISPVEDSDGQASRHRLIALQAVEGAQGAVESVCPKTHRRQNTFSNGFGKWPLGVVA
jgi:hypothetical protein